MKIPGSIKILGHVYDVNITKDVRLARSTVATICPNLLRIDVAPGEPESRTTEGLLHEVIEALNFHMEIDLQHHQITAISEGLFQVLRDNDDLDFSNRSAA